MKKFYVLILCGVCSAALVACSSTSSETTTGNGNVAAPVSRVISNRNSNINSNLNQSVNSNINSAEHPAAPGGVNNTVNAVNSADSNLGSTPFDARKNPKLEAMRKAARSGVQPHLDEAALIKAANRPAPDNSEFATILTNAAIEVRTFNDHPQLLKVEKRSDGKASILKVYLKNGKVIQLPGDKIPSLGTEPAAQILQIAGVH